MPDEAEQVIDHLRDAGLGVDPVCRVLGLSPSTYFARKKRPHDPHTGTLTAVVMVSARAYALLDPGAQQANVAGWGRAFAVLARTGHVARIQVL